jgi:hypothetical protein
VTTGAPIYLVSACGSGEEFIAAFRKYADRTGLFVPIAEPLPAGRRATIALTLKDGGVMLHGEAEVVQSSSKPSALYGRVGMTLKFVAPDNPSRTILGELERARLAMKPAPPSVAPRPATIPAQPRPVPPLPGGRIDATNALAECVAIGDVAALRDKPESRSTSASPKFAIPTIPARVKSPSTPPPTDKAPAASTEPAPTADSKPTTIGTPPVRAPAPVDEPPATKREDPLAPTRGTPPRGTPVATSETKKPQRRASSAGGSAQPDAPRRATPPAPLPVPRPPAATAPDEEKTDLSTPPVLDPRDKKKTSIGFGAMPWMAPMDVREHEHEADHEPTMSSTPPPAPVVAEPGAIATAPPTLLDLEPPDPPEVPRLVPAAPILPGEPAPPATGSGRSMRASEILAAIPADENWTMTPDAAQPTVLPPSPQPAVPPAAVPTGRAPTGDWTITPDAASVDGWGQPEKTGAAPHAEAPTSGNPILTVSSQEARHVQEWEDKPTGIGEPLVQIDSALLEPASSDDVSGRIHAPPPPELAAPATRPPPPPLHAAFAQPPPFVAQPPPFAPPSAIPPTPAYAMPGPQQQRAAMSGIMPAIPTNPRPPSVSNVTPGQLAAIPPAQTRRDVTDGGTGFFLDNSGAMPHYPVDEHAADSRRRKRTLIIAISAALVVVFGIVLVATIGGGGGKSDDDSAAIPPRSGSAGAGSAAGSSAGSATGAVIVASGSNGSAAVVPPTTPKSEDVKQVTPPKTPETPTPAPSECTVELASSPTGAEVVNDKDVLGTTPNTFTLPCGVEVKLTFRHARYTSVVKAVTPTAEPIKLPIVRLTHVAYAVRVTSTPPAAAITVNGKSLGFTPATIKLPAFETSTVTLVKDGYATDTEKVTPKSNNSTMHFLMKRGRARPR